MPQCGEYTKRILGRILCNPNPRSPKPLTSPHYIHMLATGLNLAGWDYLKLKIFQGRGLPLRVCWLPEPLKHVRRRMAFSASFRSFGPYPKP